MELQEQSPYKLKFKQLSCCVIIPTYNNAGTLEKVIRDVLVYTTDILVVNDGSTDNTSALLSAFTGVQVLHHPVNKGKGMALRTGFRAAYEKGYKYAITIDSDGQHHATDIPAFLEKIDHRPEAILVGARNMDQASVPGKSSFGHKFSNFWFRFETGIDLPDTQSGFRLYPLEALQGFRWVTPKYEFEIEVLVRAAWKGIKIDSVPVSVYYAPKETRISHFRPFKDFSRVSVLNTVLVLITLVYIKPLKFIRSFQKKKVKDFLRHHLLNPDEPEFRKVFSVMFGVFMGIFPIWGYQLLVGVSLAHLMRLNKVIFVMAAHISIPPMIPVILFMSVRLGGYLTGSPVQGLHPDSGFSFATIKGDMYQYIIGSIALSVLASIVAGVLTFGMLKLFPVRKQKLSTFHY
jgi:glycosyltransferase involved in cell wall biosynthesis